MSLCVYPISTEIPASARYQVAEGNGCYYPFDTESGEIVCTAVQTDIEVIYEEKDYQYAICVQKCTELNEGVTMKTDKTMEEFFEQLDKDLDSVWRYLDGWDRYQHCEDSPDMVALAALIRKCAEDEDNQNATAKLLINKLRSLLAGRTKST